MAFARYCLQPNQYLCKAYILSEDTGLIGVPKRIALSAENNTSGSDKKTKYGYQVEYF